MNIYLGCSLVETSACLASISYFPLGCHCFLGSAPAAFSLRLAGRELLFGIRVQMDAYRQFKCNSICLALPLCSTSCPTHFYFSIPGSSDSCTSTSTFISISTSTFISSISSTHISLHTLLCEHEYNFIFIKLSMSALI